MVYKGFSPPSLVLLLYSFNPQPKTQNELHKGIQRVTNLMSQLHHTRWPQILLKGLGFLLALCRASKKNLFEVGAYLITPLLSGWSNITSQWNQVSFSAVVASKSHPLYQFQSIGIKVKFLLGYLLIKAKDVFPKWQRNAGFHIHIWLVVSTPLKNISQNGNLPQVGLKIKNMWNHHPFPVCIVEANRYWFLLQKGSLHETNPNNAPLSHECLKILP